MNATSPAPRRVAVVTASLLAGVALLAAGSSAAYADSPTDTGKQDRITTKGAMLR